MEKLSGFDWIASRIGIRIIEGLKGIWSKDIGGPPPDSKAFYYSPLNGQGATSRWFLLNVNLEGGLTRRFFVKIYGLGEHHSPFWKQQVKRDYDVTRILSPILGESAEIQIPMARFMSAEENVFVSDYAFGENLGPLFFRKLRFSRLSFISHFSNLENYVSRIGRGLRRLQSIPIENFLGVLDPPSSSRTCSMLIEKFEHTATFAMERGLPSSLIEESRRIMAQHLRDYFHSDPVLCLQHNDYIIQNFMVDSQGDLYVFDFPNAVIGTPYMDMAHFIASLEDLTALRTVSKKQVSKLTSIFLHKCRDKFLMDPKLLALFQLFIQFYSIKVLLSENRKGRLGILRPFFIRDPKKQFTRAVEKLIDRIG